MKAVELVVIIYSRGSVIFKYMPYACSTFFLSPWLLAARIEAEQWSLCEPQWNPYANWMLGPLPCARGKSSTGFVGTFALNHGCTRQVLRSTQWSPVNNSGRQRFTSSIDRYTWSFTWEYCRLLESLQSLHVNGFSTSQLIIQTDIIHLSQSVLVWSISRRNQEVEEPQTTQSRASEFSTVKHLISGKVWQTNRNPANKTSLRISRIPPANN